MARKHQYHDGLILLYLSSPLSVLLPSPLFQPPWPLQIYIISHSCPVSLLQIDRAVSRATQSDNQIVLTQNIDLFIPKLLCTQQFRPLVRGNVMFLNILTPTHKFGLVLQGLRGTIWTQIYAYVTSNKAVAADRQIRYTSLSYFRNPS